MFYWLYCYHWEYGDKELQFYQDETLEMFISLVGLVRTGWEVKVKVFNNAEV